MSPSSKYYLVRLYMISLLSGYHRNAKVLLFMYGCSPTVTYLAPWMIQLLGYGLGYTSSLSAQPFPTEYRDAGISLPG